MKVLYYGKLILLLILLCFSFTEKSESIDFYENAFKLEEITNFLKEKIGRGDLILVKGSQRMRMERIVAGIMANPKMASKLLVRQGEDWLG